MTRRFEDKVALVTGAASGMGDACAQTLSDLGAEVYALDIQDIKASVARGIKVDLMSEASIDRGIPRRRPVDPSLRSTQGSLECEILPVRLPGPTAWGERS